MAQLVGVAETLTAEGADFVQSEQQQGDNECRVIPVLIKIYIYILFNVIGGCFRAYDMAGVCPMGRNAAELNDAANRICSRRWPGLEIIKDGRDITRAVVKRWSLQYTRIREIHLWGSFPCEDLSRVKHQRANLEGTQSSLFWEIRRIANLLKEEFGDLVEIKQVLENVPSMDRSSAEQISEAIGA